MERIEAADCRVRQVLIEGADEMAAGQLIRVGVIAGWFDETEVLNEEIHDAGVPEGVHSSGAT
ncbi:hypothetical protein ACH4JZ_03630 [Streptomyces sp. NPDC017615]|uniref:hypothetical protein n=1 Tax=Streptomyces sp. NPDC017615 TaxID=3365003 RepID=UPI0037A86EAE